MKDFFYLSVLWTQSVLRNVIVFSYGFYVMDYSTLDLIFAFIFPVQVPEP